MLPLARPGRRDSGRPLVPGQLERLPVARLRAAQQRDPAPLPSGLRLLQAANGTRYDVMMAGAVIARRPLLALYVVAQRWIIEGVSTSGIKG